MDWIVFYLKENGFEEEIYFERDPELALIADDIKYVYLRDGIQFVRFNDGKRPNEYRMRVMYEGKTYEMDLRRAKGNIQTIINQALEFREELILTKNKAG